MPGHLQTLPQTVRIVRAGQKQTSVEIQGLQ